MARTFNLKKVKSKKGNSDRIDTKKKELLGFILTISTEIEEIKKFNLEI